MLGRSPQQKGLTCLDHDSTAVLARGLEATLRYLKGQKYTGKVVLEVCMNQGGITVAHTYRHEKFVVPAPAEDLILATA